MYPSPGVNITSIRENFLQLSLGPEVALIVCLLPSPSGQEDLKDNDHSVEADLDMINKDLKQHVDSVYCEEPCSGSFLGASSIWHCMWCQRLVHIESHANMATDSDDICDLGPYKRLILSPLCVKYLDKKTEAN